MIERQIIAQKTKELSIQNFLFSYLGKLSCSKIKMQRTPLGEKISVYTSRPGLIVGKKGANIKLLTEMLKTKFSMENPQLEVVEIENPNLDAATVARSVMSGLERFGTKRFKALAYRALDEAIKAGARGIEIVIGGRGVPGERAKSWRFTAGYLKKSGDISENYMDRAYEGCNLRSGTIGVKVSILHPEILLPDDIKFKEEVKSEQKTEEKIVEEKLVTEVKKIEAKEEKFKKPRKPRKKKGEKTEVVDTKAAETKTVDKDGAVEKKVAEKEVTETKERETENGDNKKE